MSQVGLKQKHSLHTTSAVVSAMLGEAQTRCVPEA